MRPLIYDTKFKIEEEITQVMTWISFFNLLAKYFFNESLFILAYIVGKSHYLRIATINKIGSSYVRVKVQVNLKVNLSKYVKIEIENEDTREIHIEQLKYSMMFIKISQEM